jgi:hypothetical protein
MNFLLRWGETVSVELGCQRAHCPPSRWAISEYGAAVEWYWQRKSGALGETPVSVPLCPPQIPHGLTWTRTWTSAVRIRRLVVWSSHGLRMNHDRLIPESQSCTLNSSCESRQELVCDFVYLAVFYLVVTAATEKNPVRRFSGPAIPM